MLDSLPTDGPPLRAGADDLPPDEPSLGDMARRLVGEGKAYARAEAEVVKARAMDRVDFYKAPVALFAGAALFALAGIVMLCGAVGVAVATATGPLWGALASVLFAFGVAALLAGAARGRLKGDGR
jgi:hypothetical protein